MLGIANAQVPKLNRMKQKTYYELYAAGPWGQKMCRLVPFMEPDKAASAEQLLEASLPHALDGPRSWNHGAGAVCDGAHGQVR